MSRKLSTQLYFGGFFVWLIGAAIFMMTAIINHQASSPPPVALVALAVMAVAGIVMLVAWIGALIRLAQLAAWGWFAGVLAAGLIGVGIIAMIAYALGGPTEMAMPNRRSTLA